MKDKWASTFHRDGTVTLWNSYTQSWLHRMRPEAIGDRLLSTLNRKERERIAHILQAKQSR